MSIQENHGLDSDMRGNVRDSGRSELHVLMRGCATEPSRRQFPSLGRPSALVVIGPTGEDQPLRQALEDDGWSVKTCPGPARSDCPLIRGQRCSLRDSADAAVVYIQPQDVRHTAGANPRVRCAADSASPGVLAMDGSASPARYAAGTATVGSLRGPDAIITALDALLATRADE